MATSQKNSARFINQSCSPNCKLEIVKDMNEKPRACLIAKSRIHSGTELTFDYKWEEEDGVPTTPCHCRPGNCKGMVEYLMDGGR